MLKLIPLAVASFVFVVVMFVRILTNDPSDGRFEKQAVVPNVLPPLVDARDGQSYGVVKIGDQVWMSENLNFGKMTTKRALSLGSKWCEDNKQNNCDAGFGGLYSWNVAMKACPQGWHLPDKTEWETLFRTVGGDSIADRKLRARNGWDDPSGASENWNGSDEYGLAIVPAGVRPGKKFSGSCPPDITYCIAEKRGTGTHFWTSSGHSVRFYIFASIPVLMDGYNTKDNGFSVRCVKD